MESTSKVERVEGLVEEVLPNFLFRVTLKEGEEILAYLGGRLKLNRIKVIAGDRVLLERSASAGGPVGRGRIIRRL